MDTSEDIYIYRNTICEADTQPRIYLENTESERRRNVGGGSERIGVGQGLWDVGERRPYLGK